MTRAPDDAGTASRSYDALSSGQDSRLIVLALIAIIGILAIVVAVIIAKASEQLDEAETRMTATAVMSAVEMRENDIARLAVDYTWWDVSYEQVAGGLEPEWAEDNLGPWLYEEFGIDIVAVIDEEGRTIYYAQNGVVERTDIRDIYPDSLSVLIDEARASPLAEPEAAVGYLPRGQQVDLVAVSPFTHSNPDIAATGPPVRAVLVFANRLDEDWTQQLEAITGVRRLSVVQSPPSAAREAMPLADPKDARIGHLSWARPDRAGTLVAASTPWLVAAFVSAMILSGLVAMRFSRTARQLALRNQELLISEAQARDAQHRAEKASRAKSWFLASMSHEVRTPLNAIIGFSDVLRRENGESLDDKTLHEYSSYIHSSGQQLLVLLNDILDLAKVEAGKLEMRDQIVDLQAVLTGCIRTIAPLAGQRSIMVETALPETLPALTIDPHRLRQVLLNLIDNAVKFSHEGGQVMVRVETAPAGLEIAVEDNGIGIAEEDQGRIFEPFTQVQDTLSRETGGTGLGLALVRLLIVAVGGTISLHSVPGKGTTVRITLPRSRLLLPDSPQAATRPADTSVDHAVAPQPQT